MKFRRAALMLIALSPLACVVVGCGLLNPASRLHGVWKLDVEASIEKNANGNDIQAGLMRAAWGMIGADVIVEYRSDSTVSFSGSSLFGGSQQEGTWKLASAEGDALKVEIEDAEGQTQQLTLQMIDADTFEVDIEQGQVSTVVFRRQKE